MPAQPGQAINRRSLRSRSAVRLAVPAATTLVGLRARRVAARSIPPEPSPPEVSTAEPVETSARPSKAPRCSPT